MDTKIKLCIPTEFFIVSRHFLIVSRPLIDEYFFLRMTVLSALGSVFLSIAFALHLTHYTTIAEIIACQDRFVALGTDKNMAKIVDVTIGANVQLLCDFW